MYGYRPDHAGGRMSDEGAAPPCYINNGYSAYAPRVPAGGWGRPHGGPEPPPPPPPTHDDELEDDPEEHDDLLHDEEEEEDDIQEDDIQEDDIQDGNIQEDDIQNEEEEEEEEDYDEERKTKAGPQTEDQDALATNTVTNFAKNRKRPRPSAYAYLQGHLDGISSNNNNKNNVALSDSAQTILKDLLRDEEITLVEAAADVDLALAHAAARRQPQVVVQAGMTDAKIMALARTDELCFLGSLLHAVEERQGEPTRARHLSRRGVLAVHPRHIPGALDAEEFTLAAMEFLAADLDPKEHPHFPRLPLIRAVNQEEEHDLRKRAYVKAYMWKLEDIMESVAYLDHFFLADASDGRWTRRETFAPVTKDEAALEALFLKGRYRASTSKKAKFKKPKGPVVAGSIKSDPSSNDQDPVASEAHRIMQEAT